MPDRLPPAISPKGDGYDHDCVFRRMSRTLCERMGVKPNDQGLYDFQHAGQRIEMLRRERDDAYSEVMEARAVLGLDPFSTHGQLLARLRELT